MRSLLIKEMKLAASPLSYLFLAFAVMTLIPGYPILVGCFFVCLGIFQSFQSGRENNDILYTVLLPVEKADAVRAKYLFVCAIELEAWLIMAGLTALRVILLADATVYVQNPMMNANPVYLGWAALVFGLFNAVFLRDFFRTAYKFAKPFVTFIVLSMLLVMAAEVLHHIPGLTFLNGTDRMPLQLLLMAAGLLVFAGLTALSLRRAIARFEVIDL